MNQNRYLNLTLKDRDDRTSAAFSQSSQGSVSPTDLEDCSLVNGWFSGLLFPQFLLYQFRLSLHVSDWFQILHHQIPNQSFLYPHFNWFSNVFETNEPIEFF